MKHKSLILAALILLSGCNINSSKESSINKSIDAYIEEIYSALPDYITSDYLLPSINDSSYIIEYNCPGIKIINNTLIYEDKNCDYLTSLSFKISFAILSFR